MRWRRSLSFKSKALLILGELQLLGLLSANASNPVRTAG